MLITASNSAKFRPQYAWLRSDEQSQLLSIQNPSREGEPVLLIEYNGKALGGPTDMILEITVVCFCRLEETSSFYFLLTEINKLPSITTGGCPEHL